MPGLVKHDWIFPIHDVTVDGDLSMLHPNNQLLYGEFLHLLKKGRTWFGLNFDWPSDCPALIPENFDTYVFSWHLENWDNHWLDRFCETHPSQQIVVIGEFDAESHHDNLRILVHHCWHLFVPYLLDTFGAANKFCKHRPYRLSSLCNKPSVLKALISAHLLEKYHPRNDLLLSWNKNVRGEHCRSMDYLTEGNFRDRPILDRLIRFYHRHGMINRHVSIDDFVDNPWNHCDFTHPAFTQSLVNATNETFAQNQIFSKKLPGPYTSEKTWKTVLGGAALLPIGQSGMYPYMQSFGLRMDYPWPREFDNVIGDLDRIEKICDTVDWILSEEFSNHEVAISDINHYNYEYVRSRDFVDTVEHKNQLTLEHFLERY